MLDGCTECARSPGLCALAEFGTILHRSVACKPRRNKPTRIEMKFRRGLHARNSASNCVFNAVVIFSCAAFTSVSVNVLSAAQ